jgi:uncharacterized membrane protein
MIESLPMNRFVSTAIPLGLFLVACGNPPSDAPPAVHAAVESANAATSKIPMRGVVATSGGAVTFRECGAPGGAAMSVADDAGVLAKAFASLGAKPADGIYVELDGVPAADGKSLSWSRLLRARALRSTVACETPVFEGEFVASGDEPFWAIEIREGGIVYRDPAIPKGRVFPYAFTRTETGTVVYATKLEKPTVSTIEVALEPAACLDARSGELRSFKAHVVFDGRKLEGCALAGVPHGEFGNAPLDELNRFAGAYPHTVQLWRDPALSKRLETLLGRTMSAFLENMKVESPLMKDNGVFYVTGNKTHQGRSDSAVFLADPASDTIAVILFVNGSRRDFKEGGRDLALPAEVVGNMEKH